MTTTGWRRWTPWLLIVLAAALAFLSALSLWVKRQALDTENWTNASSDLLANSEIRSAISVYLVDELYENVDVSAALEERLPPATKPLAGPVAAALEPALVRAADTILARDEVQALWRNANGGAHALFLAVLEGERGVLEASDGEVVLDLRPLLEELAASTGVGDRALARLPEDAGRIVVMEGNELEVARDTVSAIEFFSYFLSLVVLALFAAAVYIARGRRRTMLFAIGASLTIVGLLVLVARRLAGSYLVDALTDPSSDTEPVGVAWAIGTELLRDVGINGIVYGLLVMAAAWVAGPSDAAVELRRLSAPTMRDRPALVYGALAVGLLLLLLSGPTDGQRLLPLLVLFALAFVGMEVLRRQAARESPPTGPLIPPGR